MGVKDRKKIVKYFRCIPSLILLSGSKMESSNEVPAVANRKRAVSGQESVLLTKAIRAANRQWVTNQLQVTNRQ